jgi:hypothetical protein
VRARKPRKPPRPPQSWSYDREAGELTIVDCDGAREVYRVLPLACQFGRGWELVKVGSAAFGEFYHVHRDGAGYWSCTCPGGCYANQILGAAPGVRCKHTYAASALAAERKGACRA